MLSIWGLETLTLRLTINQFLCFSRLLAAEEEPDTDPLEVEFELRVRGLPAGAADRPRTISWSTWKYM